MSTEYPGLDRVARQYWQSYLKAALGLGSLLLITGSLAAVVVLLTVPEATWYLVLAGVSYGLHMAAMFIRDVWSGEYEPSQATFSSGKEFIALIVIMGAFVSSTLFIGSVGGYLFNELVGMPGIVGAVFAMYYAVIDVMLIRNGIWTPGKVVMYGVAYTIGVAIDFHRSILNTLPVVGKRHRPHQ